MTQDWSFTRITVSYLARDFMKAAVKRVLDSLAAGLDTATTASAIKQAAPTSDPILVHSASERTGSGVPRAVRYDHASPGT